MLPQSDADLKQAVDRLNRIRESYGTHDLMFLPEQPTEFLIDESNGEQVATGKPKGIMEFLTKLFRKEGHKTK